MVTVTAHLQLQPGPGRGLGVEVCLAGVVGLVEAEDGVVSGQRGELLAPVAPDHGHEACTQHTRRAASVMSLLGTWCRLPLPPALAGLGAPVVPPGRPRQRRRVPALEILGRDADSLFRGGGHVTTNTITCSQSQPGQEQQQQHCQVCVAVSRSLHLQFLSPIS